MRIPLLIVVLLVPAVPAAWAADVTGTISSVDGYRVWIAVADGGAVRVGDRVELSGEVPGLGMVAIDGVWRVVEVSPEAVVADLVDEASGRPQSGYRAVVQAGGEPAAGPAERAPAGAKSVALPLRGTFIAGTESGRRSSLDTVATGIRNHLAGGGVHLREMPSEIAGSLGRGRPLNQLLAQVRSAGGRYLLYLTLKINTSGFSMGRDRLSITCYDSNGQTYWTEEVSNLMTSGWSAEAAAADSVRKVINKMNRKLDQRMGSLCLAR